MPSVSAVLRHSLFTAEHPNLEAKRRQDIATIPSRYKRLGAIGLHNLAVRHPERIEGLLNRRAHTKGYRLVGRGWHSDVFLMGENVLKVLWRTAGLTEPERHARATELKQANKHLKDAMGTLVVPETTRVAEHPFVPRQRVVQIEQAYHDFSDPKLFIPTQSGIDEHALESLATDHPGVTDALRDFCTGALKLHDQTGMMPDTNGPCNLVLSQGESPELLLIDGQPIPAHDPEGIEITRQQVGSLALALTSYQ